MEILRKFEVQDLFQDFFSFEENFKSACERGNVSQGKCGMSSQGMCGSKKQQNLSEQLEPHLKSFSIANSFIFWQTRLS